MRGYSCCCCLCALETTTAYDGTSDAENAANVAIFACTNDGMIYYGFDDARQNDSGCLRHVTSIWCCNFRLTGFWNIQ